MNEEEFISKSREDRHVVPMIISAVLSVALACMGLAAFVVWLFKYCYSLFFGT
jgi:hypothetical protein